MRPLRVTLARLLPTLFWLHSGPGITAPFRRVFLKAFIARQRRPALPVSSALRVHVGQGLACIVGQQRRHVGDGFYPLFSPSLDGAYNHRWDK